MSDLVRNPEDRFSCDKAQIIYPLIKQQSDLGLHCFPRRNYQKLRQVAQRATIAHLKANFTFSCCKSMGDDDPRGLANLDPRGMIGRIYVWYH